jgi:hypothetical protein
LPSSGTKTVTTISDLERNAGDIFGTNNNVPQPEIAWQHKLDALEAAGLMKERAEAIYEMRCQQASGMGFEKVTAAKLVKLMGGEEHNKEDSEDNERQNNEWFLNHHTDEIITDLKKSWGGKPTDYSFMWRRNGWWLPPFNRVPKWTLRWGKISFVKRQMPHALALRIHDLKKLKIFNVFNYLGTLESYEKDTEIKGVVTGSIWEIPPNDEGKFSTSGKTCNFFIGVWE